MHILIFSFMHSNELCIPVYIAFYEKSGMSIHINFEHSNGVEEIWSCMVYGDVDIEGVTKVSLFYGVTV